MANIKKYVFPGAPDDTVSSLSWSQNSCYLCATSWNGSSTIWDISRGIQNPVLSIPSPAPLFTSSFLNPTCLITAGANKSINKIDLNQNKIEIIGTV